jgi:outer membrane lipoprotein-sorting protein
MSRYSWVVQDTHKGCPYISQLKAMLPFAFLFMLFLAACGSSSATQTTLQSTPTPSPAQGKELLTKAEQHLKTAKTLHAIFDIHSASSAANGIVSTEVWNVSPNKSRTVVLQSTLRQVTAGSITINNGKQIWQYDPNKKVVYTGQVSNTTGTSIAGKGRDQTQFIMNIVQSVFTQSNATLVSSSVRVNGHDVYDIQVTSPASASSSNTGSGTLNYNGDVFLDKTSMLPVQVQLTIQGFGKVTLNLPMLVLDQPVDNGLFTFVPPAGVKVLPFPKTTTPDTGTLSLQQAQLQAGYHLLSIPTSQSVYQLQGVDALGAPGNQIFTLNYAKSNSTFAISEGKSLSNLPISGQQVRVRGTTATLSTSGNSTTLTWTEKGVGIQISGNVSKDELLTIAKLLV